MPCTAVVGLIAGARLVCPSFTGARHAGVAPRSAALPGLVDCPLVGGGAQGWPVEAGYYANLCALISPYSGT